MGIDQDDITDMTTEIIGEIHNSTPQKVINFSLTFDVKSLNGKEILVPNISAVYDLECT